MTKFLNEFTIILVSFEKITLLKLNRIAWKCMRRLAYGQNGLMN